MNVSRRTVNTDEYAQRAADNGKAVVPSSVSIISERHPEASKGDRLMNVIHAKRESKQF